MKSRLLHIIAKKLAPQSPNEIDQDIILSIVDNSTENHCYEIIAGIVQESCNGSTEIHDEIMDSLPVFIKLYNTKYDAIQALRIKNQSNNDFNNVFNNINDKLTDADYKSLHKALLNPKELKQELAVGNYADLSNCFKNSFKLLCRTNFSKLCMSNKNTNWKNLCKSLGFRRQYTTDTTSGVNTINLFTNQSQMDKIAHLFAGEHRVFSPEKLNKLITNYPAIARILVDQPEAIVRSLFGVDNLAFSLEEFIDATGNNPEKATTLISICSQNPEGLRSLVGGNNPVCTLQELMDSCNGELIMAQTLLGRINELRSLVGGDNPVCTFQKLMDSCNGNFVMAQTLLGHVNELHSLVGGNNRVCTFQELMDSCNGQFVMAQTLLGHVNELRSLVGNDKRYNTLGKFMDEVGNDYSQAKQLLESANTPRTSWQGCVTM